MSLTAVLLVLLSAFVHAGWNLFSKRQCPTASYFLVACLSGTLLLSPSLWLYGHVIFPEVPFRIWGFILISGFFLALYYISLAGAYRAGEMSVAYPLARSSPVIVVTIVTWILGRGDQVSVLCVAGIVLVVGGCFLIPLKRLDDLRLKNYLNSTCALALLAAIGSSGYSIVDDEALRQLRAMVAIGKTQVTLFYACLEAFSASCWLYLFVTLRRRFGRPVPVRLSATGKRDAAFAGIAIYFAYVLVLISLAFSHNVSYVVGFRQLSVPLGAILGVAVLKETLHGPKMAGVAIMFVGLILVAMG